MRTSGVVYSLSRLLCQVIALRQGEPGSGTVPGGDQGSSVAAGATEEDGVPSAPPADRPGARPPGDAPPFRTAPALPAAARRPHRNCISTRLITAPPPPCAWRLRLRKVWSCSHGFARYPSAQAPRLLAATLLALPHPVRAQTAPLLPWHHPRPPRHPRRRRPTTASSTTAWWTATTCSSSATPETRPRLTGRVYDVRNDSPALAMAELNVFQNPRPGALGFKATLVTGDATDINHYDFEGASGGQGEARFKNLQQLYGSYAFGTDGAGVDVGKFVTPFGYEQIEATGNNNYSHSIPFGLEPTYQFGARIYTPPARSASAASSPPPTWRTRSTTRPAPAFRTTTGSRRTLDSSPTRTPGEGSPRHRLWGWPRTSSISRRSGGRTRTPG